MFQNKKKRLNFIDTNNVQNLKKTPENVFMIKYKQEQILYAL